MPGMAGLQIHTAQFIPWGCVEPIILKHQEYPQPFFSGTGFFASFPPFSQVFFVTAKHCVVAPSGEFKGQIQIGFGAGTAGATCVPLDLMMTASLSGDPEDLEDVAVYVVGQVSPEEQAILEKRALRLNHRDEVDLILATAVQHHTKLRTVGFPGVSKEIDYDTIRAVVRPRGFHGDAAAIDSDRRWFDLENMNWAEGDYEGFSGSPIIELLPTVQGGVGIVPVGIMLTAGPSKVRFISINVATDIIATYLREHRSTDGGPDSSARE